VSRACLRTRSPRPRSCPWSLSAETEGLILTAREKTNYGPMQLQFLCRRRRSTIYKVLARHGVSRRRRSPRERSTRRYEWAEAGALLHIDAFELPKFDRPGHWATGQRAQRHKTRNAGKVKVIGVIDDHTPLGLLRAPRRRDRDHRSATLRRASEWFREQGCGPVQAVMSDNANCYARSHGFRDALAELGARHILIPPYTPRWNGKIERFWHTLDSEWAHGRVWPNSTRREEDHAHRNDVRARQRIGEEVARGDGDAVVEACGGDRPCRDRRDDGQVERGAAQVWVASGEDRAELSIRASASQTVSYREKSNVSARAGSCLARTLAWRA